MKKIFKIFYISISHLVDFDDKYEREFNSKFISSFMIGFIFWLPFINFLSSIFLSTLISVLISVLSWFSIFRKYDYSLIKEVEISEWNLRKSILVYFTYAVILFCLFIISAQL